MHHIKLGSIIFPEPTKANLSNVATVFMHLLSLTFLPPYFISSKGLRRACTLPYMGITGAKSPLFISGFSLKAKTKTKYYFANSRLLLPVLLLLIDLSVEKKNGAMAEQNPQFNRILNRVREKLRSENVKLWLPPYTLSNDQPGSYPEVYIGST